MAFKMLLWRTEKWLAHAVQCINIWHALRIIAHAQRVLGVVTFGRYSKIVKHSPVVSTFLTGIAPNLHEIVVLAIATGY